MIKSLLNEAATLVALGLFAAMLLSWSAILGTGL